MKNVLALLWNDIRYHTMHWFNWKFGPWVCHQFIYGRRIEFELNVCRKDKYYDEVALCLLGHKLLTDNGGYPEEWLKENRRAIQWAMGHLMYNHGLVACDPFGSFDRLMDWINKDIEERKIVFHSYAWDNYKAIREKCGSE